MPQPPSPRTPPPLDPAPGPREPNTGRGFKDKFVIYLTGVAIGIMLLGWFQARKKLARQAQQSSATTPAESSPAESSPPNTTNALPAATDPDTPSIDEPSPG